MDKKESGKKLDQFLAGKGFYIVLLLCAAIIGVSAWSLVSGGTKEAAGDMDTKLEDSSAVSGDYGDDSDYEAVEPTISEDEPAAAEPEDPPATAQTGTWTQGDVWTASASEYVSPLEGKVVRAYSMDELQYDKTMADWRTHDGIDIAAKDGTTVMAIHSGKVDSVTEDDMYGVTVVINQGGGVKTTYSNLRSSPAVKVGDSVSAGDLIGYIGATAICESAEEPHLHLTMNQDGKSLDPAQYIPA